MRAVEEAIMTRLKADTAATVSLQALLGSSGRIRHALEIGTPKAPGVYYKSMANAPGTINADSVVTSDEFYQFRVYATNAEDVMYRLRVLLDRYTFPDQTDVGSIRCIWDSDGPDAYDDMLELPMKTTQFRIFMVPKAAASV
jgi:hypothetical protein